MIKQISNGTFDMTNLQRSIIQQIFSEQRWELELWNPPEQMCMRIQTQQMFSYRFSADVFQHQLKIIESEAIRKFFSINGAIKCFSCSKQQQTEVSTSHRTIILLDLGAVKH